MSLSSVATTTTVIVTASVTSTYYNTTTFGAAPTNSLENGDYLTEELVQIVENPPQTCDSIYNLFIRNGSWDGNGNLESNPDIAGIGVC